MYLKILFCEGPWPLLSKQSVEQSKFSEKICELLTQLTPLLRKEEILYPY